MLDTSPVELLYECEPFEIHSLKCIVAGIGPSSQNEKEHFLNRLVGKTSNEDQSVEVKPTMLLSISLEETKNDVASPTKFVQNPPDDGDLPEFRDFSDEIKTRLDLPISQLEVKEIIMNQCLHIVNIGDQPEISEIVPLLIQGPALYLLISRSLEKDAYDRTQMLYQFLSSIYVKSKQFNQSSKAILFAGHKEFGKCDEEKELEASLKNADFSIGGFLVPVNQSIIYPIDNEIEAFKTFLKKKVIKENFKPQQIRYTWGLFYVALRHRYKAQGICQYNDCVKLANECGIQENVSDVLESIHHTFGTILYYKEISGLNELVICDPNVFLTF